MRHLLCAFSFSALVALLFFMFPGLDIGISSLFFDRDVGFRDLGYRVAHKQHLMVAWHYVAEAVVPLVFIVGVCVATVRLYLKNHSLYYRHYLPIIYIITSIIVGPVIGVYLCKEMFHRARPYTITEFHGEKKFTAAFVISDQCSSDCSFVSRHATVGFMLFSLAFLVSRKQTKNYIIALAIFLGLFFGLSRIIVGQHFASDIIFAGFLNYISAYGVAIVFKMHDVRGITHEKEKN